MWRCSLGVDEKMTGGVKERLFRVQLMDRRKVEVTYDSLMDRQTDIRR